MSEFDIKKYLKKLKKTLEEKEFFSFFVMADQTDFKPIKGEWKETQEMFKERASYYAGKRVAHISLYPNIKGLKYYKAPEKYNIKDFVFSTKIVIYKVKENGTLSQSINDTVGVRINYEPDDLENKRFNLKDVEKFMRLCAEEKFYIETLNGQWYKKIIKILKKKGIDFEAD